MKLNIFLIIVGLLGMVLCSTLAPAVEGFEAVAAAKQVAKGGFENYVAARAEMMFWAKFAVVAKVAFGILFGWNTGALIAKLLNRRTKAKIPAETP